MIVTMQMYDWPEVRDATDAWWNGIARHLGTDLPLSRADDYHAVWHRSDVLLSQTCGYPFTHDLRGRVTLVATPHYGTDGCEGPNYCSMIFAREDRPLESFRGSTAAVNTRDSMSGMLALKLVFAPLATNGKFFARTVLSGGHLNSLAAVREGQADVCAIDAVCVGLARRYRPSALEGLVVIARSPSVPGLPYITTAGGPAALREGLKRAFADPELESVREQLLLSGLSVLDARDYDRITDLETQMDRSGGLELA